MAHRQGNRLEVIAELVPAGARVLDVGTDHARLARLLLASGRASFCIASDVSDVALAAAAERSARATAEGRLVLRRADGLAVLADDDRVDVAVLAGIGGRTVLGILERHPERAAAIERLVLQPQSEVVRVRRWCHERRWAIVDERWSVDRGRAYPVLAVEPGRDERWPDVAGLTLEDLFRVGPVLVRSGDPRLRGHWRQRLRHLRALGARRPAELSAARRIVRALEASDPTGGLL